MRKWNGQAARAIALLLTAAMTAFATGCGNRDADQEQNGSGMQMDGTNVSPGDVDVPAVQDSDIDGPDIEATASKITDFGLRLLKLGIEEAAASSGNTTLPPHASMPKSIYDESLCGRNVLLSPLSVLSALVMTANGARGETQSQMEEAFGISVPELSACLWDYQRTLPAAEKYKLTMANAIWFTADERFTVEEDFLKKNEELFESGIRRVTFDSTACKEINDWVKDNTDGMIEEILDEIPADAVMYLVNALAFDAEWERIYRENEVREGEFKTEDGNTINVEMMYSEESQYLEDTHATGFLKYYADRKYAYAALLPEEGMTVAEYVATLDGEKLRDILSHPTQLHVNAAIPKYESEYSTELRRILEEMGMQDAFDSAKADFSGIGRSLDGNIFISRVLHKTYIAVDEKGTKAGAATAVEMRAEGAMPQEDVRTVYLNRPFVYMILDCEHNLPLFLGVVEGIS